MRTIAIIQARLASTRLPGKALMVIGAQTMLGWTVTRTLQARSLDAVAVATTVQPLDEAIVQEADNLGVFCYRGSEDDVLDRYMRAAREMNADVIVRITSDCPLIDPGVVDRVVTEYQKSVPPVDYCSNTLDRTYPQGLDTEVFSREALEQAWREATGTYQREHVTPYLYEHPEVFRLLSIKSNIDYSTIRWTVDTAEDLSVIRQIFETLDSEGNFDWQDVIAVTNRKPHLLSINRYVKHKDRNYKF